MVLTKQEAEVRVQELLAQAKLAMDEVTALAREHKLEPSFMEMTFHHKRERWGDSYRLLEANWYSDEYWNSSTADCEVGYSYEGEEP
jgi:hypothetical protein